MKHWIAILLLVLTLNTAAGEGLNVVILGDSNTWIGGDNCDKPKGWNHWFRERMKPATCRSYARSGATWTNTPLTVKNLTENIGTLGHNNVIYNQIMRLTEAFGKGRQVKPDLILIMAGTNDVWFRDKRPQVFDATAQEAVGQVDTGRKVSEVLTLAGSVSYGVALLQQQFPQAQIILLTPMQTTAAPYEDIVKAGDIIEDCGQRLGCGVIRMDKGGAVSSAREAKQFRYTSDGTHTSPEGARRNGYYIARQVEAMLEF